MQPLLQGLLAPCSGAEAQRFRGKCKELTDTLQKGKSRMACQPQVEEEGFESLCQKLG